MTVPQIIGYVLGFINQLGLTPYIQAGMLVVVTVATLAAVVSVLRKPQ
jgi:hypothetical protein